MRQRSFTIVARATYKGGQMTRALSFFMLAFAAAITDPAAGQQSTRPPLANTHPAIQNLVPDEKTAITITIVVLTPIYGERQIKLESPFRARLSGEVWTVEGTLPRNHVGGVATVTLSKNDARILSIVHSQ
jgi:hypothetical protein